ncbi:MAG: ABC transporter ATP-binding protein [Candidatus Heimdallarchaeota archaeon]|nr:ABC transporter ATP-binding protein [Candidatus Heimdallarchaeota archaeon]MCK4878550.1 ABC transporter ATP-binding protein [Candidatus Heimdallarchaeota archaeon]
MVTSTDSGVSSGEFFDPVMAKYDKRSHLRWVLSHITAYKGLLVAFVILSTVSIAISTINPILMGNNLVNEIIASNWSQVRLFAFIILSLTILNGLVGFANSIVIEVASQKVERDIRDEYYASMLSKSMTFHDTVKAGDVMARATFDTRMVNYLVNPCMHLLYLAFVQILFAMGGMLFIDPFWKGIPVLFLIPVSIALPIFFLARRFFKSVGPISMKIQDSYSNLSSYLQEKLLGISVVKTFARDEYERLQFKEKNDTLSDQIIKRGRLRSRYFPALIVGISVGFSIIYGVILIQAGIFNIGQLFSYVMLISNFFFPIWVLSWSLVLTQMGIAGAKRITSILTKQTVLPIPSDPKEIDKIKGNIDFKNVNFSYDGKNKVVNNVSFSISAGSRVAIVGPAGSGKTTVMKLLTRLYDVDDGRILLDGENTKELTLERIRKSIGVIEQDVVLFSGSVKQNISYGNPEASDEQIIEAAKMAQAHDFIMNFDKQYDTVVGERGMTLSGGQKQRVAIARMILSDPEVLVFDDATSSVDSETEDDIQTAINRVLQNRTSFVITHRLSTIRHSDIIIVMKQGAIVAKGKHEELLKTSIDYWRVFARFTEIRDKFEKPIEGKGD